MDDIPNWTIYRHNGHRFSNKKLQNLLQLIHIPLLKFEWHEEIQIKKKGKFLTLIQNLNLIFHIFD